ncbi:MAG: hypothetical protein KKF33_07140 [Alphaproteobacteria bacterium]|nr:hypothetical protein [Alphaproteobacteria bacterium]
MTATMTCLAQRLLLTTLAVIFCGSVAADDAVNRENYVKLRAARLMDQGDCVPYWYSQVMALEEVAVDIAHDIKDHTALLSPATTAEELGRSIAALDEEAAKMASSLDCEQSGRDLTSFGQSVGWIRVLRDIVIAKHMHVSPPYAGIDFVLVSSDIDGLIILENKIGREFGADFESVKARATQEATVRLQFMLDQENAADPESETADPSAAHQDDARRLKKLVSDLVEHAAAEWLLAENGFVLRSSADGQNGAMTLIPFSDPTLEFPVLSVGHTLLLDGLGVAARAVTFATDDQIQIILSGPNRRFFIGGKALLTSSLGNGAIFEGKSTECAGLGHVCFGFGQDARDAVSRASDQDRFNLWLGGATQTLPTNVMEESDNQIKGMQVLAGEPPLGANAGGGQSDLAEPTINAPFSAETVEKFLLEIQNQQEILEGTVPSRIE